MGWHLHQEPWSGLSVPRRHHARPTPQRLARALRLQPALSYQCESIQGLTAAPLDNCGQLWYGMCNGVVTQYKAPNLK